MDTTKPFNIDNMLGSLADKSNVVDVPVSSPLVPLSDSVASPSIPSLSINESVSSGYAKRFLGFIITLGFLLLSVWGLSVQYPLEFEQFRDFSSSWMSSTYRTLSQNIAPIEIVSSESSSDTLHSSASVQEVFQNDIPTPLADSLSTGSLSLSSDYEKVVSQAVGVFTGDDGSGGGVFTATGMTMSGEQTDSFSTGNQQLLDRLLYLQDQSYRYQMNFAGAALSPKATTQMAIARAVHKKSQQFIAQGDSFAYLSQEEQLAFYKELDNLESLIKRLEF